MTGPYFTKPTLRNVLCNVPLTISFFVLMLLSKIVPVPMGLSILFVLPVIVASAFVTGAYDVLHRKATFLTFPISLLLSLVLIYQFLQNTNLTLWFSSGDENKTATWILCGVLCLLAAPILTFFINWMLMRDDDSQSEVFERLLNSKILYTVVVCCIAIAFVLFAVFIFNPYFWYDEGFTLKLIQLSYTDVIDVTALDVHPPLYYIMLKAWLSVLSFGSNDLYVITVLSHLFSLVAYVLTGLLCLKKIHDGGNLVRWLLLLCLCACSEFFRYGLEIRMYSWALFFVTATFLYARDVMSGKGGWKTWLIITLFTLCAAYTHYYALLSVSIIWVIMLVWFCLRDRRMLLRLFVCGIIVVIVYLPWLVILLQQVRQVSAEYWIKFTTGELLLTCFFLFLPVHFILPFLFVKVLRTKNGRISFDDIMGLCVLIGIFVVGLIMSIVIKPVLVARYIFPAGLCMWISVFLIFRHARNKEKFLFVCLLLFAFLVSSCKKVGHFVNDCKDMQATHLLLDTIDNDATFAYETDKDGLDYLVLSCFTNNEIVAVMPPPRTPIEEKMLNSMFRNVTVFGYRKEMWKYLKSFKKIYYISHNATSGDAEAILPPGYTGVYIGDYRIEQSCHIYKLIPNGEHGE